MATAKRVPEPLIKRRGGGGLQLNIFTAITLVPLIQCQNCIDFLKAQNEIITITNFLIIISNIPFPP